MALAVPIQRLNCAGQRWPTWDETQEEGEGGEAGSILHSAKEPGVLLLLVGLQLGCVCADWILSIYLQRSQV